MPLAQKRRRSGATAASSTEASENLRDVGSNLSDRSHQLVMTEIWNTLWMQPDKARDMYIMLKNGAFDQKRTEEASQSKLTTNNKYHLVPRDIYDKVLQTKAPLAHNYFRGKTKAAAMEFTTFVCDVDPMSAVYTKSIPGLVHCLTERFEQHKLLKLGGEDMPAADQDSFITSLGYFALAVREGDNGGTFLVYNVTKDEVPLPAQLQKQAGYWTVSHNLHCKKAAIVHGEWESHNIVSIFAKAKVILPPPLFLKSVPIENVSPKPKTSSQSIESPLSTPRSHAGTAASSGSGAAISPQSSDAAPPPPPPPAGFGGST